MISTKTNKPFGGFEASQRQNEYKSMLSLWINHYLRRVATPFEPDRTPMSQDVKICSSGQRASLMKGGTRASWMTISIE